MTTYYYKVIGWGMGWGVFFGGGEYLGFFLSDLKLSVSLDSYDLCLAQTKEVAAAGDYSR